MKIDRLIGILAVLLQQEKATAPELAKKFEVSRRTIGRDIDTLCQAGIPLVTTQGQNGGISIMEGYKIDRTLLTSSEMQAVLAGLRSLDSVSGSNQYGRLMEKFSAGSSQYLTPDDTFLIDLSSWYKDSLSRKIEEIRAAIESCRLLRFTYYAPSGESVRRIEAYRLVFHWSSWYVWGFCLARQDFRLFKLNRMEDLRIMGNPYEKRLAPPPDLSPERVFPPRFQVKALFAPECRWRLIEDFGRDSFVQRADGKLLFSFPFADKSDLLGWLLTFGGRFELLEPEELRAEMAWIGCSIQENHSEPFAGF